MKRILLIILSVWAMLTGLLAQELSVKGMRLDAGDLSASTYERKDLNGAACALVKVQLAANGARFEGNVIGDVAYKTGEYWVYMTDGSRELRIKHPNFLPLHVHFANYGIERGVKSKQTYTLTLLMPQTGGIEQKQKLIINYTPANATVLIDSKLYKGNGRAEAVLPVGSHSYVIAAEGYETAEATVKLTASAPRTVTEHLVAVQQTSAQSIAQQAASSVVQQTAAQTTLTNQTTPSTTTGISASGSAVETITVKGVSFNMVRVEGGTFTMGATSEQGSDALKDERPAHQVTLPTYSIGETEVTQALWEAVMGKNPSNWQGENLPVEQVSWKDCQKFITKLNKLTGRHFRLPTEAEWEYAARGGNRSRGYKYSGSNSIGDVAWYDSNSSGKTHPVKTKQANELGLYDMSGNVYEWCQDWYDFYSSGSLTNPTGPSPGSHRVGRGGSWSGLARFCRVSYRIYDSPDYSFNYLGLRLALSFSPSKKRNIRHGG